MDSTCKDFLQVRQEGSRTVKRMQIFFNLDVIISVGYRVKSKSSPDMSHRSLTCWGLDKGNYNDLALEIEKYTTSHKKGFNFMF